MSLLCRRQNGQLPCCSALNPSGLDTLMYLRLLLLHQTASLCGSFYLSRIVYVCNRLRQCRPAPGPLDLEIVDGADHFFDGIWDMVAEKVLAWIQKQLDAQQVAGA